MLALAGLQAEHVVLAPVNFLCGASAAQTHAVPFHVVAAPALPHLASQDFPSEAGPLPNSEHAVTFVPSHVALAGQSSHPSVLSFQYLPSPQVHFARPSAELH